nr:hypothetical protein [Tanacetum cinerariifolium]
MNGWIKADMPLLRDLGEMCEPLGSEADESIVDLVVNEVAKPIVEMEEQMVALVVEKEGDLAMLLGYDDFSDANSERFEDDEEVWELDEEWLMAFVTPPLMPVMPSPSTYEDLGTHMGNLEYGHGQLVKKVIKVSDAEVADGIAIGEIGPRVSAIEGQVHVMASKMVQVVGRLEQIGAQMEQGQQADPKG